MTRPLRIFHWLAMAVLASCLGIQFSVDASQAGVISLTYRDEPLKRVLERIGETSGFDIVVDGATIDIEKPISGSIDHLPLDMALQRILSRSNYTIVWDERKRQIRISLYEGSTQEGENRGTDGLYREKDVAVQRSDQRHVEKRSYPILDGQLSGSRRHFIQGTPTAGP